MVHGSEIVILLLAGVAAFAWLASRLHVPYPVFLVLAGLGISLVPGLPRVELHPELVFVLFLPPLLYYPALQTSWRDFRTELRPILFLSVGLVLFTTCCIAILAHTLIDGLTWPAAFALGAIISPPDAVAATSILERLRIPRRIITLLEGESLVNDAAAIVAYRFAVAAAVTGAFSLPSAGFRFLLVAIGGIAIGFAVARFIVWLRPRLHDGAVESAVSLLTPYLAYLPAEWAGVSGVLAAVTAGIYVGRHVPRITSPRQRLLLFGNWETLVFLLNGFIFILIGLQLPVVVGRLRETHFSLAQLAAYAAAIFLVTLLSRALWVIASTYLPRLLSPAFRRRYPFPPKRQVFVVAWVGLRGIVSLAAAMALPHTLSDGVTPFPGRDLILFVTFGVILATLTLQGLTLPLVIRLLRLRPDDGADREESVARREATHAALARLMGLEVSGESPPELVERVRALYAERLKALGPPTAGPDGEEVVPTCQTLQAVQREALAAERAMLIHLRDTELIADDVLRRVQRELDLEEARIGDGEPPSH